MAVTLLRAPTAGPVRRASAPGFLRAPGPRRAGAARLVRVAGGSLLPAAALLVAFILLRAPRTRAARRVPPSRSLPAPGLRWAATRRLVRVAAHTLLAVATLLVVVTEVGDVTARWGLVPVLTGSMRPGIHPGDLVLVTPEPVGAVRVGQVLVFRPPGEGGTTVIHRVTAVTRVGGIPAIRTKGDANDVGDSWTARLSGPRAWRARAVLPDLGYLSVAEQHPGLRHALELALVLAGVGTGLAVIWRRPDQGHEPLPARVPGC